MLADLHRPRRSFRTRAIAIVIAMLVVVLVSQVASRIAAPTVARPATVEDPLQPLVGDLEPGILPGTSSETLTDGPAREADLERIRANVAFWGDRVARNPDDFVSSNRLGISEIEMARATGDLSAYGRAEAAFAITLRRDPTNAAALGYRGSVLVSLHRFVEAADLARSVLDRRPDDPVALATLGDAELELGHVDAARDAYERVDTIAPSSATKGRLSRLAFISGDPIEAVDAAKTAVASADREGAAGERAAFYHYQLADTLLSTGDRSGARMSYAAALESHPGSFLARSGLARVAAGDGDLDEAIELLTAAIAIVPQPDFLARRADLYVLRAQDGDDRRSTDDYATVEAIATLGSDGAAVYDRTLALYLADHGLEPDRAVSLTEGELAVRQDVYGFDAAAWALLQAGRPDEADALMAKALAFGTQDAKLLYHAGSIDAALGRVDRARSRLGQALELDPGFDPLQAMHARDLLKTLP